MNKQIDLKYMIKNAKNNNNVTTKYITLATHKTRMINVIRRQIKERTKIAYT